MAMVMAAIAPAKTTERILAKRPRRRQGAKVYDWRRATVKWFLSERHMIVGLSLLEEYNTYLTGPDSTKGFRGVGIPIVGDQYALVVLYEATVTRHQAGVRNRRVFDPSFGM
ncbi:hypothetical protein VE03_06941 [Pseudogymnoascus sp. 23342-1-I1]|nr:hypothetical protein VE03_06941 [Pseudogymnoascus sp. 23342-1-I1]